MTTKLELLDIKELELLDQEIAQIEDLRVEAGDGEYDEPFSDSEVWFTVTDGVYISVEMEYGEAPEWAADLADRFLEENE